MLDIGKKEILTLFISLGMLTIADNLPVGYGPIPFRRLSNKMRSCSILLIFNLAPDAPSENTGLVDIKLTFNSEPGTTSIS